MIDSYILGLSRLVILLTFSLAFIGKVRDFRAFQDAVIELNVISPHWSSIASWGILANELLIVISTLLGGRFLLVGFLLAGFWLVVFMLVVLRALLNKSRVACNCFGAGINAVSIYDFLRNLILLFLSVVGIMYLQKGTIYIGVYLWQDWVIIGLISAIITTFIINLHEIARLFRQSNMIL